MPFPKTEIVKPETNIPMTVALAFDEGKPVEGQYGPQVKFGLLGNKTLYASMFLAQKIEEIGVKKGEPFTILKKEAGNKTEWLVYRAGEGSENGRCEAETATGEAKTTKPVWTPKPTITARRALFYAIRCASEASAGEFSPEDIRHMAISMFIQLGHCYEMAGDFDEPSPLSGPPPPSAKDEIYRRAEEIGKQYGVVPGTKQAAKEVGEAKLWGLRFSKEALPASEQINPSQRGLLFAEAHDSGHDLHAFIKAFGIESTKQIRANGVDFIIEELKKATIPRPKPETDEDNTGGNLSPLLRLSNLISQLKMADQSIDEQAILDNYLKDEDGKAPKKSELNKWVTKTKLAKIEWACGKIEQDFAKMLEDIPF